VHRRLLSEGYAKSFLINEAGTDVSLDDRGRAARDGGASLFLSLHHDSVQPSYLSRWTVDGQHHAYSDRFHGYSVFTSRSSPNWAESMEVAKRLGHELRARNHTPTLHHAEQISGERRPLLDADLGVYAFDGLAVLKSSTIPAVLLECGVLVNRDEEIELDSPMFRAEIVDAIAATVEDACERRDAVTVPTRPAASTAQ
jgi:N-acetylmuramoyl-L-alanine amidase